jgi:hypothetical protein
VPKRVYKIATFADFAEVAEGLVYLGSLEGYKLDFTYGQGTSKMRILQIAFVEGGKQYLLSVGALFANYFTLFPEFETSLESFHILSGSPAPSSPSSLGPSLSESASALNYGNIVNFTAVPNGGPSPYTHTWFLDGQEVQNGSSPYYSTNSAQVGAHHVYVETKDGDGVVSTTNTVEFNVLPPSSPTPSPSVAEFPNWIIIPIAAVAAIMMVYFKKHNGS